MALLVSIFEMCNVFFKVVVILCCDYRRRWAAFAARPVASARHSSLETRSNAIRLLPESFGLAHSFAPPHTGYAVVVLANVDRNVDFDESRLLFDAQFGGLAAGGFREGLVGRSVEVLQDVELLLLRLGCDVDIVLCDHGIVVFYVHCCYIGSYGQRIWSRNAPAIKSWPYKPWWTQKGVC